MGFDMRETFEKIQRRQQSEVFGAFGPEALLPGSPYRLRPAERDLNLAPSIRSFADGYFKKHGIQWHLHANHALSSQVCCLNFLMPLAHKPDTLARLVQAAVGGELPNMIAVENGPDDEPVFVGFEWIGGDHLRESSQAGKRSRGANATAADAVVMFERGGVRETLLIEWKYTERYGAPVDEKGNSTRSRRYGDIAFSPHGPLRGDLDLLLADFFFEPFYQMLRQQMLADHMQRTAEDGAARVRVLHLSPLGNTPLHWVTSPGLRRFGDDAFKIWPQLLSDPESFVALSIESLFGPLIAENRAEDAEWSAFLQARYGFLAPVPAEAGA